MDTSIAGQSTNGMVGNYAANYISQAFSYPSAAIGSMAQTSNSGAIRGLGAGVATVGSSLGGNMGKAVYDSVLKDGLTKGAVKSGLSSGLKSTFSGAAGAGLGMSAAGAVLSAIAGPKREYSGDKGGLTKGLDTAYDAISTGVQVIPGVGQIIGGAMQLGKGVGAMVNKWGGGTDAMTTTDAILGSNFFNLTPTGMINGFGGKTAHTMDGKDFMTQSKLNDMWAGYGSTYKNYMNASSKEGKKYGLFSSGARKKANKIIDKANMDREYLLDMNAAKTLGNIRGINMVGMKGAEYAQKLAGGIQPISIGRSGVKLTKKFNTGGQIHQTPSVIIPWIPDVQQFKEGGTVNVIPEGNLHARLHHMEDADGLTKKGIPVVDNNGNQQAEIELNEIIFRKEVTDKLEELSKQNTDQAALEAGKLLVKEIFENTEDRTGLISEVTGEVVKAQYGTQMSLLSQSPYFIKTAQKIYQMSEDQKNAKAQVDGDKTMQMIGTFSQAFTNGIDAITKGIEEDKKKKKDREELEKRLFAQHQETERKQLKEGTNAENYDAYLNSQRQQLYAEKHEPYLAQEGGELNLNFKTYQELLDYLKQTDRDSDEDYDLEAAFNDPEVYQFWRKEEEENPGKGHWLDKYKKESHMTYSNESILGDNPKQNGGYWVNADGKDIFIVSPYLENKHSIWDYFNYFNQNEPNASFRYKGITYSTGRKKK